MPAETLLQTTSRDAVSLGFAYTAQDTPAIRDRIGADLTAIVAEVRARDPAAMAVVLTGGFARGEGGIWAGAPLNDYDLLVVRRSPVPRSAAYAAMVRDLERNLGLHVDLMPVWVKRIPNVEAKIFWYETREWGQVIWGPSAILKTLIPAIDPATLPAEEALRLLFNRTAGLLLAYPGPGRAFEPVTTLVQSSKAFLACVEALLVLEGRYHGSVVERLRRFDALAAANPFSARIRPHAAWATQFKLGPEEAAAGVDPGTAWAQARACILDTASHAVRQAGFSDVDDYAERAPVSASEAAVFAMRSIRSGAPAFHARPSPAARRLAFRLLTAADPTGASDERLAAAARSAWFGGAMGARTWPDVKQRFFALRGRTLQ